MWHLVIVRRARMRQDLGHNELGRASQMSRERKGRGPAHKYRVCEEGDMLGLQSDNDRDRVYQGYIRDRFSYGTVFRFVNWEYAQFQGQNTYELEAILRAIIFNGEDLGAGR